MDEAAGLVIHQSVKLLFFVKMWSTAPCGSHPHVPPPGIIASTRRSRTTVPGSKNPDAMPRVTMKATFARDREALRPRPDVLPKKVAPTHRGRPEAARDSGNDKAGDLSKNNGGPPTSVPPSGGFRLRGFENTPPWPVAGSATRPFSSPVATSVRMSGLVLNLSFQFPIFDPVIPRSV
jgi:hypothetical protein